MFKRIWIYTFTTAALIVAALINYFYPLSGLWMLFLPSMFGLVVLFPRWLSGHIAGLIMPIIRILTLYIVFDGDIPGDFLNRLISTSIVAWVVILIFTFYNIKLNDALNLLKTLSLTDNLTKAYNRRYLDVYFEQSILQSKKNNDPLCFLIFDIDYFKRINDTYGHSAGDAVLQKMSQIVQNTKRDSDVLVRLGGEEFAIIIPNATLQEGIIQAEKVRAAVSESSFDFQGEIIRATISIGVVQRTEESLDQLIERADKALYQAKINGRNLVVPM